MSSQPKIWGKYFWYTIHYIALGFPDDATDEDKDEYKNFFVNLHQVIPCYKCSVNYIKHLHERPLEYKDLQNSRTLFKWTVDIHNIVNKNLKKRIISIEEATILFSKNNFQKNSNDYIYITLIVILVTLLSFSIYKNLKK